ncbi:hypothetical protein [Geoglobus acetivorans]|uniref:Uncharacterized protein n=1 Tax=Geoglobus acetivorans TaxID=565033 RepID=A0ABZ3H6R6_GEOAI|nr:hypothetical protein [Geoglobus acetivorans]
MEDTEELRKILEKVERKIVAVGKIYSAINFAYWLMVMSVFYVVLALFSPSSIISAVYWIAAMIAGVAVSGILFRRIMHIAKMSGEKRESKTMAALIFLSWVAGAIIGFIVLPATLSAGFGAALLSFLSISLFGMWAVLSHLEGSELEMVPSFLITAIGAVVAFTSAENLSVWAGFVIAAAFSITILLYLYSAFRIIGD